MIDTLKHRLEARAAELEAKGRDLDPELQRVSEEHGKADVIARHVIRNPEKFSPHERENVIKKAEALAMQAQEIRTRLEETREELQVTRELLEMLPEIEVAAKASQASALEVKRAIEEERVRIARDLHDGPAQVLSNLVLEIEIMERLLRRDPQLVAPEFQEFKNSLRNAVGDLRRLTFDLRPVSLDDLGLIATMKRMTSEYQDRTGVVCRFNVSGDQRRLPPEIEEALYWIIQEALTNVHRHSAAKRVEVSLEMLPERVWMRIRDDGRGFDPAEAGADGGGRRKLGLLGMRERVAAADGRIEVQSQPGSGTQLDVEFTLAAAPSQ